MFSGWIHWLSSQRADELLFFLMPLLLLDVPRYCLGGVVVCLWDALIGVFAPAAGRPCAYEHCPSVCVVVAGLNEADTIEATLRSLWGSYPKLQIIVVDDGSTDEMAAVAKQFAAAHDQVLVLRKPERGGKSSALNFALPFTKAEIVVCVDADSHLEPQAIWEIVQPFADGRVGAVGGTVRARNGSTGLVTRLQSAEYLRSIFVGRMLTSRLGMLGIVSGAFGAFRREALDRAKGWDVGPGEDGDLVLRLRKASWRIVHAPYAQCRTNLPTSWSRLFKQRRRWAWATVTFECRKHVDMANVFSRNFRLSNLALVAEAWTFDIVLTFAFFAYLGWLAVAQSGLLGYVLLTNYAAYLVVELIQWLVLMYYSPNRLRDGKSLLCAPWMPLYYSFLKGATLVAVLEETLFRRSFDDSFVPQHVRQVTWRW